MHSILHDSLQLRKLCARWIPHQLHPQQKNARVNWCKEMLKKFNHGRSRDVAKIITGDETWIYHYDPQTKQQSREWCEVGYGPPTKVRRTQFTKKQIYAIFFNTTGVKTVVPLEPGGTINSTWYTESCLPKVIEAIHVQRPGTGLRGTFLHHDNASSHRSKMTRQFVEESGLQLLPHPPYSPDLAPCDFWLFPRIKKHLKGKKFDSNSKVEE